LLDATDNDKVYLLGGAGSNLLEGIPPFSIVSLTANLSDGALFLSTRVTPAGRNVPVVACTDPPEAAVRYPPALLERFLFSSWNQYAIEDHALRSARVVSTQDYRVTVEFTVDLKPVVDPFARIRSRWPAPGADGYLRDVRLVLVLYSNDGFYCTFMPEWWDAVFAEGISPLPPLLRETMYQPVRYPDLWQALYDGHVVEEVLYEEGPRSYISETKLRKGQGLGRFETRLHRVDRLSGAREPMSPLLEDTFSVRPLAAYGNRMFIQTEKAYPASEGYSGHVASIDVETLKYTILLPEPTALLGKVGDTVYLAFLRDQPATPAGGIYALNIASGEIRRVSDLLGPVFSTAYESASLRYASSGKLYISWPQGGMPGDDYALFALDPGTGASEQVR
jgi:hypothetical protein